MALTHSKMTRRRQEVELQIAFLQQGFRLRASGPWPSIKNLKRDSYPIIIRRRMLTLDEQRRVIWLRFGSLDNMDRRWHSATEVKEMTGVSLSNQHKLIKRWLERNCRVVSLLCLRGSKIKIPEETRAHIASPQQLLMQRHMSL